MTRYEKLALKVNNAQESYLATPLLQGGGVRITRRDGNPLYTSEITREPVMHHDVQNMYTVQLLWRALAREEAR